MAHLETGRLNLRQLREATRRLLLKCLDECPGSKVNENYKGYGCSD